MRDTFTEPVTLGRVIPEVLVHNWLYRAAGGKIMQKHAVADRLRIQDNIERLSNLQDHIHELGYFVSASQSGGFFELNKLLEDQLVRGRPKIYEKLKQALIGENNQKLALDAPHRFSAIMREAEDIIIAEIGKEQVELRKITGDSDNVE